MDNIVKSIIEVYRPKVEGEVNFADKHIVVKHKDRNGNGDDVFNASKIKPVKRAPDHGYNQEKDTQVYEDTALDESKHTVDLNQKTGDVNVYGPGKPGERKIVKTFHRASHGDNTLYKAQDFAASANKKLKEGVEHKATGMRKITEKLSKDDVISSFINKYVAEEKTLEEKVLTEIKDMSDNHIVAIMGLFESLDEENQRLLYFTLREENGAKEVLDFIIGGTE